MNKQEQIYRLDARIDSIESKRVSSPSIAGLAKYLGISAHYSFIPTYSENGTGLIGKLKSRLGIITTLEKDNKCLRGQVGKLQSDVANLKKNLDTVMEDSYKRIVTLEEYLKVELVDEETDTDSKTFYRKLTK